MTHTLLRVARSLYILNGEMWCEDTAGGRTHLDISWSSPRRPCLRMTAISVQEHVPLRDLTTLKIGGTARYFVSVSSVDALKEAVAFAKEKRLPFVLLGGGSNVLVGDRGIDGLVIKLAIRGVEWIDEGESVLAVAGAGESWDALVADSVLRGLWGLENLSGIPGSVGAAPIQNIGAYGAEIKDRLEWVEAFDTNTGAVRRLLNTECCFAYRESLFKRPEGKSFTVTRVALRLSKNGTPNLAYQDLQERFKIKDLGCKEEKRDEKRSALTPADIRTAVLEIRSKKFPDLKQFGTAGSFFKNPIIPKAQFDELKKKYPALPGFALPVNNQNSPKRSKLATGQVLVKLPLAWILDNLCGLKGYQKGTLALFTRQPIVLVNTGGASAQEIEAFAEAIASRVREKTGIEIQWEVEYLK